MKQPCGFLILYNSIKCIQCPHKLSIQRRKEKKNNNNNQMKEWNCQMKVVSMLLDYHWTIQWGLFKKIKMTFSDEGEQFTCFYSSFVPLFFVIYLSQPMLKKKNEKKKEKFKIMLFSSSELLDKNRRKKKWQWTHTHTYNKSLFKVLSIFHNLSSFGESSH